MALFFAIFQPNLKVLRPTLHLKAGAETFELSKSDSDVNVSLTKNLSGICLFKHNSIGIGEKDVCCSFLERGRGICTATWRELRGTLVYMIHV